MKLFEITYYSIQEGYMTPETSWLVQFKSSDDAMTRCSELTNKFHGIFMCKLVGTMTFEEFNDDFVSHELEML